MVGLRRVALRLNVSQTLSLLLGYKPHMFIATNA